VAKQDGVLLLEVDSALKRLVKEAEFAAEIERLKLRPLDVVAELSRNRAVLASANQAFESVAGLEEDAQLHRKAKPTWWPVGWRPSSTELRCLIAMVGIPVGWAVVLGAFGIHLPDIVVGLVTVIAAFWTIVSALFGLPVEVGNRLLWTAERVRLAVLVPSFLREQRQELRDHVLRPELRKWLGKQMTPSFDVVLALRAADDLSLPAGEGPLVRTTAVEACAREINRALPGAVGLAGPRGAGKSTIIRKAVANEFTDSNRSRMLGVVTSAPVRYDARDFVLHLHACVCRAVLDLLADPGAQTGSETRRQWLRVLRRYQFREDAAEIAKMIHGAVVRLLLALGFAGLAWEWHGDAVALGRAARDFVEHLWPNVLNTAKDLDPHGGAAVLALYFAVRATWMVSLLTVWPFAAWSVNALWRRFTHRRQFGRNDARRTALKVVTEQHLRAIRFLQTHTEGWSGKVSAPIGSELGWTRSLAKAEQPWTHPEVVERLRDFLGLVVEVLTSRPAELSGITVAIDELDKISDPEDAQRFLNEIKGVFGVRHCLFLVSVSDDALTAFERRGIPARDAFDSAFTTMIHVRSFSLDESRDWLAQRALGITEPFVWLCHCLSAGLPRDLGRTAIALHDLHEREGGDLHLADVARTLVRQDLDLKIRAFTHTARQTARTDADPAGQHQTLIRALQDATTADVTELFQLAEAIWRATRCAPSTPLVELGTEAACYFLFCQAIIEMFNTDFTRAKVIRLAAKLGVEGLEGAAVALAEARRQMAIDSALAWDVLVDFRVALGTAHRNEVATTPPR
jgi:hypothetical protein